MFGLLPLHLALGCMAVEAQETPLPEGATEFRDAMRSFQAVRAWVQNGDENHGCIETLPRLGDQFIVSVRADGVVVSDNARDDTRHRWDSARVTRDVPAMRFRDPTRNPSRQAPREEAQWRHSVAPMQAAVAALRHPETQWITRGPAPYGRTSQSTHDVEIVSADLDLSGYRAFVHFALDGMPSHIVYQGPGDDAINLTVHRLEFDPPLPADWFDEDAREFSTRFPAFDKGEPLSPLDAGFYAPGAKPPVPAGGVEPPPAVEPSPPVEAPSTMPPPPTEPPQERTRGK